ncbi:MAG: hypothetical protein Q9165_002335 [Trypethelium subeluteriae]
MHCIKTALFALAAWVVGTNAQSVVVLNNCTFDIFIISSPNNGGASTAVETIASGANYTETYTTGSAIKVAANNTVESPLTVEYTPNGQAGLVYYDLSNNAGNPFADFNNILAPRNSSCFTFNCAAGSAGSACYSNGANIQVKACTFTDLTTTVCAA